MKKRFVLVIVLLSSVFVYLQVFVGSWTPILRPWDQTIYLHDATRMLEGQLIYRDYDHFTFPGTDVLYMVLFRIFGVRAWIAPAMLVFLGACAAWIMSIVSRKLVKGWAAFLPAVLFVTLPFAAYLDATHHWYSTVLTLAALAVLIEKQTMPRLAWAGILVGLATFFTQSAVLVAVAFVLFLLWERHQEEQSWRTLIQKEASLLISFLATLTVCLSYFIHVVGLKRFFYYTAVFVVKYYPAVWVNTWHVYLHGRPLLHHPSTWTNAPAFVLIQLIVPFIYFPFLFVLFRKSRLVPDELRKDLMLITITGLFLFLSVASAPSASRLYTVSAPAIILLIWFLDSRVHRHFWSRLLWATVLVLAIARPLATQMSWKGVLDLPVGRTAFLERTPYEKCDWLLQRTRPSDYYFNDPSIAFALRLRNPSRVPTVLPTDYTRPEEVRDAIDGLETFQVRFVSWNRYLDDDSGAPRRAGNDNLGPLRRYLREHYRLAATFPNGDQIWERNL